MTKHTLTKIDDIPDNTDRDSLDSTTDSSLDSEWLSKKHEVIILKLSNRKYAASFPVKVNNNQTFSLFDTGATVSCLLESCFDKLDPKPLLIIKHPYRVKGTDGNILGHTGTATCTLEFPKKFQQPFIICNYLLRPIILGLGFSHNYQIGIDWFSTHQLHLHQGPQSIVVSDCTPFSLHINQISTLPPLLILIKTILQATIPARTLAVVPTTFTNPPKTNCYYDLSSTQPITNQDLFIVPLLKIFSVKLPTNLLCTIINTNCNW